MVTAARDDDFIVVKLRVHWPEWVKELSAEELENVLESSRNKMLEAFVKELEKAERHCMARKKAELEGQTTIYDYA